METNNNIQNKIDSAFEALDAIDTVHVSPFFKDKTIQRLFKEKEVEQKAWSWFTPKLQLATLVCVVVINVIAFTKLEGSLSYEENLSAFAESYGFCSSDDNISILN
jgi:hypothetical protein